MIEAVPTRELRRRMDLVLRGFALLAVELPRAIWHEPGDAREILKWLQDLDEHLDDLRLAVGFLQGHIALLKDLAGEEWEREREAERLKHAALERAA